MRAAASVLDCYFATASSTLERSLEVSDGDFTAGRLDANVEPAWYRDVQGMRRACVSSITLIIHSHECIALVGSDVEGRIAPVSSGKPSLNSNAVVIRSADGYARTSLEIEHERSTALHSDIT